MEVAEVPFSFCSSGNRVWDQCTKCGITFTSERGTCLMCKAHHYVSCATRTTWVQVGKSETAALSTVTLRCNNIYRGEEIQRMWSSLVHKSNWTATLADLLCTDDYIEEEGDFLLFQYANTSQCDGTYRSTRMLYYVFIICGWSCMHDTKTKKRNRNKHDFLIMHFRSVSTVANLLLRICFPQTLPSHPKYDL